MADKKSMKHLVKATKKDPGFALSIGALNEMMERQALFAKRFGITANMTEAQREKWTKEFIVCILDECSEVLGQINWKHWKKTRQPVDMHEVRFEVIDLLHFVLSLAVVWGMTADDVAAYYIAKSDENRARQKRGY